MEMVLFFKPSLLSGVQSAPSLCPTEAATLQTRGQQCSQNLCAWLWLVLRLAQNSLHQALAGGLITGMLDIFSWVLTLRHEGRCIWPQLTFHTGWNLEFRVSYVGWRTTVEKNSSFIWSQCALDDHGYCYNITFLTWSALNDMSRVLVELGDRPALQSRWFNA